MQLSFPKLARRRYLMANEINYTLKMSSKSSLISAIVTPEKWGVFQTSPTQLALLGNLLRSRLDFITTFFGRGMYQLHCILPLSQCPANKVLRTWALSGS